MDLFCLGTVVVVVLGVLQFMEGIYRAISVFPEPFSIFDRFLSELGRDSKATADSRRLFERSTVLLGLSMFPFFYGIARAHAEELPGKTMAFCSCGIASATGLMGIGVTPYNRFLAFHICSILLWLIPMLFMVLSPLGSSRVPSGNAVGANPAIRIWHAFRLDCNAGPEGAGAGGDSVASNTSAFHRIGGTATTATKLSHCAEWHSLNRLYFPTGLVASSTTRHPQMKSDQP